MSQIKNAVWAASLAAMAAAGCQTACEPHAKTGWRFEVLKPAVMVSGPNVTAVTSSQTSGLVGIDQNTALTGMPGPAEASATLGGRYRSARTQSYGADCTLDELCQRLDRIERRIAPPAPAGVTLPPIRSAMPPAAPCP